MNEFTRSIAHDGISAVYDVIISRCRQPVVSAPSVGPHGTTFHHRCSYEADQTRAGGVRYDRHPDPSNSLIPFVFYGYNNKSLSCCSATTFAGLLPANVGFVHFDETAEPITPGAYHCRAHLVQPCPRSLITSETQYPFQAQSARAVLLACHPPESPKPHCQGLVGVLKDRSGDDRNLVTTLRTLEKRRPYRVRFFVLTPWTSKALRPPEPCKVVSTRLVGRKRGFELVECPWVILHTPTHYM